MQNVARNILEFSGVWSFHGYVNESDSATSSFTCCRVSMFTEVYANPLGVRLNLVFSCGKTKHQCFSNSNFVWKSVEVKTDSELLRATVLCLRLRNDCRLEFFTSNFLYST